MRVIAVVLFAGLVASLTAVPAAGLPGYCRGYVSMDCDVPHDMCDVLEDLCGGEGCVQNMRYCIVEPIKSCGYGGDHCILP